jgi:hypothetical protein
MRAITLSTNQKDESSMCGEKLSYSDLPMRITTLSTSKKAESLTINSVGQRPTKRSTHANPKPQRGVIDFIIKQ